MNITIRVSGGGGTGLADSLLADRSSLVSGDLASSSWTHEGNALWQYAGLSADGYQDAWQLSRLSGTGRSYHRFCTPPQCTSVLVSFAAREAASRSIRVRVLASDLTTVIATTTASLVSGAQTVQLTASGLTPNASYAVAIETSDQGQLAAPVLGRVGVQPIGVSDTVRIGVHHALLGGTSYPCSWDGAGYFLQHDAYAEMSILTDADRISVESWCTSGASPYAQHSVLVSGRPWALGTVWPAGAAFEEIVLPAASGSRLVTVRSGFHQGVGTGGPFLRAIYLPLTCNWTMAQSMSKQRLVLVGDSITMGGSSTVPAWEAYAMALRHAYPGSVIVDAYNGRSLFTDAETPTKRDAFGQKLSTADPTDIQFALGVNDWLNSFWNAADFGAAYAATLDAIHARLPRTRIACQTPIHAANESANANGSTLGDYCTAILAAAAARAPWAVGIDGRGSRFPQPGTDLADGLHPSTIGHRKYGDGTIAARRAAGLTM